MASITASVGRLGGVNRRDDVITVQELINKVPQNSGGPVTLLKTDGICGQKTINAIQRFQLQHFGWSGADGRVDPTGQTLLKLNEFNGTEAPVPNPFPPLTMQSMLLCPHGGQARAIPRGFPHMISDKGSLLVTISDQFIIAGCCYNTPCVRVQWVYSPAQTLDIRSIGLCLNAMGVVQGTVMVVFA